MPTSNLNAFFFWYSNFWIRTMCLWFCTDPENFGKRPAKASLEFYEVIILPMILNCLSVASDFVIVFMTINRVKLVWVSAIAQWVRPFCTIGGWPFVKRIWLQALNKKQVLYRKMISDAQKGRQHIIRGPFIARRMKNGCFWGNFSSSKQEKPLLRHVGALLEYQKSFIYIKTWIFV